MQSLINHWDKANAAANDNDKTAVRELLIEEIENTADADAFAEFFNPEDRDERVRNAAKSWVKDMESAAARLRENNDAEALELIESASSTESDFGDNPSTAHILSAAQWLAAAK